MMRSITPSSNLPSFFPQLSHNRISILKELCVWIPSTRNGQFGWALSLSCNALSNKHIKDYPELIQDGLPVIRRQNERVEDAIEGLALKVSISSGIVEKVESIREMLKSMEDGEITPSPYDTAWVSLVKDINEKDKDTPQFPSSLQWIADNQLHDGSWGDQLIFSAHDRVLNTLACLVALKSWGVYPHKQLAAISFLEENMEKLENEKDEHMPIGFEVAFPSLIEIAKTHGIEVTQNSPTLEAIHAKRLLKLTRIPMEILHKMPTTLLHSLEGLAGLDWEKLLKLQTQDGSFLFSPSSTAYALMHTKDLNSLSYLNKVVQKFNGGVPNVYPVDLFEHLWVVDRLLRLGISRYFENEIKGCMSYVHRYWKEDGIGWARNSDLQDVDDTAMGFRLLRLHGYPISADVFKNFEKDGEFFCFSGQSTQAVTGMYNLFRATQLQYNGENILQEAQNFSSKYLRQKQASNALYDKWIITKDLPGEVGFALDFPWHAILPRVETRFYIEQYGGENDVWIGKTLYRMPYVNNNSYLELAKLDFNNCQTLHRLEWQNVLRWHLEHKLEKLGVSERMLLMSYFLASATIFEPEKSKERLAWVKTAALVEAIASNFGNDDERKDFIRKLGISYTNQANYLGSERLLGSLLSTLNQLSLDALVTHGRDIRNPLYQAWEKWLRRWEKEGDREKGKAELLVHIIELCAGRCISDHVFSSHPQISCLLDITNKVCHELVIFGRSNKMEEDANNMNEKGKSIEEINKDMQKLVEMVISNTSLSGVDARLKQTCLSVAKTFYYAAYCSPQVIDYHISKVLFQKVD